MNNRSDSIYVITVKLIADSNPDQGVRRNHHNLIFILYGKYRGRETQPARSVILVLCSGKT